MKAAFSAKGVRAANRMATKWAERQRAKTIPNPFSGIIDTLRECNEQSTGTSEEKCFSCGEHFPATWDHYRWWKDNGEECDGFFCDECIKQGKAIFL